MDEDDIRGWLRLQESFKGLERTHPEVAAQIAEVIQEVTADVDPLQSTTDYWEEIAAKLVVQLGILRAHVRKVRRESLH